MIMNIRNIIDQVLECTQAILESQINKCTELKGSHELCSGSDSHLMIPAYSAGQVLRISEQELRFIFVEQLSKVIAEERLYYSVETPTKNRYRFSPTKNKIENVKCDPLKFGVSQYVATGIQLNEDDKKLFVSANIDLVLHDENGGRIALIEFKGNESTIANYTKDFLKLAYEEKENEQCLKYFIQVLSKNQREKRNKMIKGVINTASKKGIDYRCFYVKGYTVSLMKEYPDTFQK